MTTTASRRATPQGLAVAGMFAGDEDQDPRRSKEDPHQEGDRADYGSYKNDDADPRRDSRRDATVPALLKCQEVCGKKGQHEGDNRYPENARAIAVHERYPPVDGRTVELIRVALRVFDGKEERARDERD